MAWSIRVNVAARLATVLEVIPLIELIHAFDGEAKRCSTNVADSGTVRPIENSEPVLILWRDQSGLPPSLLQQCSLRLQPGGRDVWIGSALRHVCGSI